MIKEEVLKSFFTGSFESEYNERLMFRDYILPSEEIYDYIKNLIDIPVVEYIDAVITRFSASHFSTKDIPQFSSFYDATDRICNILMENGDNGYKFAEMGVLLRSNYVERDCRADIKYGENHCKTAADFGLIQIRFGNVCYLSCLGILFNELTETEKQNYLSRFVLRNNFINWLICRAKQHIINLDDEMNILSPSTIKRRKPNVIYYLNLLKGQSDSQVDNILSNIQCKTSPKKGMLTI